MEGARELGAVYTLQLWNVPYLNDEGRTHTQEPLKPSELIATLIQSHSARLRLAVVPLFLCRPELSRFVLQVLPILDDYHHGLLKHYYTAAVYLQSLWKSQLPSVSKTPLSDYFSVDLNLPDPNILHGRLGLFHLEDSLEKWTGYPYNYQSSFQAIVSLLLQATKHYETKR